MAKAEFARVIFHLPKDTFPPNADMECPFEITPALEANKWDWVGIFPVGWKTMKDYSTYQYVALQDYKRNTRAFSKVTFDASSLPKDSNFYQICYISQKLKSVCGASDAIQFSSTAGKEYVEEECEDMMVIREKTDVMRDEIQALSHKLMVAAKDHEGLQQQVSFLEDRLKLRDGMVSHLQTEIKNLKSLEKQEKNKGDMLQEELEQCSDKLKSVQKEKEELQAAVKAGMKKVADLENEIGTMTAEMRSLLSEKDELSGQNQSLVDEMDTYKTQVTETQTQVIQAGKTIAKLNTALELAYNQCSAVVEECEGLKKQRVRLEEQQHDLEGQIDKLMQDKMKVEGKNNDLTQELQNANDMLAACDTMKQKLSSDLEAYEQTQQKMSAKFENQESQVRSLQVQLDQKNQECEELQSHVHHLEVELVHMEMEVKRTEVTLNQTLNNVQETTTKSELLGKDLSQMEKNHTEACRQLDAVQAQLRLAFSEKTALKEQLREFEERLTKSLAVRDQEMTILQKALTQEQAHVQEKCQELEERNATTQALNEQIKELESQLGSLEERMKDQQLELENMELNGEEQEKRYRKTKNDLAVMTADYTALTKKLIGMQKRQEELEEEVKEYEKQEQDREEEAASQFCLWKVNQTLTSRIQAKDQDIEALKETVAEEQQEKQQCQEECRELHQRLELGKLEYREKARENLHLLQEVKMIKELDFKPRSRTPSRCSATEHAISPDDHQTSDSEAGEGSGSPAECEYEIKYRALRKEHKKVKQELAEKVAALSLVQKNQKQQSAAMSDKMVQKNEEGAAVDDTESEADEEQFEEDEARRRLLYGNPYNRDPATQPPTQQTIIRSTLEEEAEEGDPLSAAAGEEGNHLPPPLEPEVVPLLGAAASADVEDMAGEEAGQDEFQDCNTAADDSFLDAIGEGMKICPFCEMAVVATIDFEEHVATHFGRICPVCRSQADDSMSPQDFEQHVNKCLDLGAVADTSAAAQDAAAKRE